VREFADDDPSAREISLAALLAEADRRGARKIEIVEATQSDSTCPTPAAKYFLFAPDPNHFTYCRRPVPSEGRLAIVTDAGRDAVDADGALTNALEADGEGVWSCAPTLASSFAVRPARRRWQESPVTEESAL
jgi:hypothetical protein